MTAPPLHSGDYVYTCIGLLLFFFLPTCIVFVYKINTGHMRSGSQYKFISVYAMVNATVQGVVILLVTPNRVLLRYNDFLA